MDAKKVGVYLLYQVSLLKETTMRQFKNLTSATIDGFSRILDQGDAVTDELRKGFSLANKAMKTSHNLILTQSKAIRSENRDGFQKLFDAIEADREAVRLISDGLKAHRDRHFEKTPLPALSNELLRLFWTDKSIKWPHRRILNFLARQWCFTRREFKEVHQNQIVRDAQVSRSMIKRHLSELVNKGLIERREAHGRILYRISGEFSATG